MKPPIGYTTDDGITHLIPKDTPLTAAPSRIGREGLMQIDATPGHPMRCAPVDEESINVAMLGLDDGSPGDLYGTLLQIAGKIRRGEIVDGAEVVAALRSAADFLN